MRTETVTVKVTCDFCGEECEPVKDILTTEMSSDMYGQYINVISAKISGSIPYGSNNPDICPGCAVIALKSMVKKLENKIEKGEKTNV